MGIMELQSGVGEYLPRSFQSSMAQSAHIGFSSPSSGMGDKSLAGEWASTTAAIAGPDDDILAVGGLIAAEPTTWSSVNLPDGIIGESETAVVNETMVELPINMQFNEGHIISVSVYSLLFIFSSVGNITVLVTILRLRMKSRLSRVNLFLLHLTIADLFVTLILMPLEIGWNSTVSWRAGDIPCRVLMFFRVFGLYLSGFVLVCISLDRYFAVLKPLGLPEANRRGRYMLAAAWIGSIICSFPQALIFHVESHPDFPWYKQCVDFHAFPSQFLRNAYLVLGFIFLYAFPLVMIIACYGCILCEICKINNLNRDGENLRRSSMGALNRAKIRTLKMTIVIVSAFSLCWTPYNVMSVWYFIDWDAATKVDHRIQKGLFLFAVANSCVNPIVYGLFHIRRRSTDGKNSGGGNDRLHRADNEAYKFRVRWKPRTQCLCAASATSSQLNSSSGGPVGRIYQRPLYELDYYRSGRAISPNARSHTTITRLNNRLSPDDFRNGSADTRGRNGPKKSRRVKFVNLQDLEYGRGNSQPMCYLHPSYHRRGQRESDVRGLSLSRSRSSSDSSSSGGHERRSLSLPNNSYHSMRSSSSSGNVSFGGSIASCPADRYHCYGHSDWNLAESALGGTGSVLERRL